MTPRGIDHIVHAVRDLDAAAAFYAKLGFRVGARNRHPPVWGTQNHIVQFVGAFVELLGLADTSATAPHQARSFSFGAHNRDFIGRGEGLSMLVLEGRGETDAAEFRAAGIGDFELFDFEREAKRPDGTPLRVAFRLAFASDADAPDVGFFTCQHRFPDNFWNPAFQSHTSTVSGIAGVVMVAENPADHHVFLSAFTGEREMLATSSGIALETPRGRVEIMTPAAYRDHFGAAPPDLTRGARLAAIRFESRDLTTARTILQAAGVAHAERVGRLVINSDTAFGATLVFEASG